MFITWISDVISTYWYVISLRCGGRCGRGPAVVSPESVVAGPVVRPPRRASANDTFPSQRYLKCSF